MWTYRVAADPSEQFEHAYRPAGAWSSLFAQQPGYRGSTLIRLDAPGEYLTIDHWASKKAFDTFTAHHRNEYDALDVELHAVTTSETLVGRGITLDPGQVTERNQPGLTTIDAPTTHRPINPTERNPPCNS